MQGTITSVVDDFDLTEIIRTLKYQLSIVPSDGRKKSVFVDLEHGDDYQSGTLFGGLFFLKKVFAFVLQRHGLKI